MVEFSLHEFDFFIAGCHWLFASQCRTTAWFLRRQATVNYIAPACRIEFNSMNPLRQSVSGQRPRVTAPRASFPAGFQPKRRSGILICRRPIHCSKPPRQSAPPVCGRLRTIALSRFCRKRPNPLPSNDLTVQTAVQTSASAKNPPTAARVAFCLFTPTAKKRGSRQTAALPRSRSSAQSLLTF